MERKIIWKFNVIDLLIIAAILVSCIVLAYRFFSDNQKASEFKFTYTCDSAPRSLLSEIKTGEPLADGDTGKAIGTVTDCIIDEDNIGGVIYATISGFDEKHGISASDSLFLKGQSRRIIIGDCIFDVYISDIEKEEESR